MLKFRIMVSERYATPRHVVKSADLAKKRLTFFLVYVIVIGRMEEHRSFFYAQNSILSWKRVLQHNNEILSGGGSRAHKNYTGMYRMQTT